MITAGTALTADNLNEAFGRIIVKPSTESVTSSTVLQNDNDFSWSVLASATYVLDSYLIYDGAADTAGGLKMQFTVPTAATFFKWSNYGANSAALTSYNVVAEDAAAGSPRGVGTNAGTVMSLAPRATLINGANAGTLQFLWAQVTSNATATRILQGSWMRLTRVS